MIKTKKYHPSRLFTGLQGNQCCWLIFIIETKNIFRPATIEDEIAEELAALKQQKGGLGESGHAWYVVYGLRILAYPCLLGSTHHRWSQCRTYCSYATIRLGSPIMLTLCPMLLPRMPYHTNTMYPCGYQLCPAILTPCPCLPMTGRKGKLKKRFVAIETGWVRHQGGVLYYIIFTYCIFK